MTSTQLTIVIVDDDEGHCELIRRNLERLGCMNPLRVFHDGRSALDWLQDVDNQTPLLLLLDINMPGAIDGVGVLAELKGSDLHRTTPIFMLSTTDDPREVARCYEAGCSAYITKPIDMASFADVVKRLGMFIGILRVKDVP